MREFPQIFTKYYIITIVHCALTITHNNISRRFNYGNIVIFFSFSSFCFHQQFLIVLDVDFSTVIMALMFLS